MQAERFDVDLTQGADDDLAATYDHRAQNRSAEYTDALLERLLNKIDTLERYPLRGSVPKELEALGIREFRQVHLQPYRLIYRVTGSKVFVLIIADGRRD